MAHIYSFPQREPPGDLLLVDCIEFNARFRYADPVADLAFLAMDLRFNGRGDLASLLADSYFSASGDDGGRRLLEFYVAYRAVVRGKVESFALLADEIPEADRLRALARARPYMLLALGALSPPDLKPCLLASTGLPGTGKSWLAKGLARDARCVRISTDRVRKRLAGVPEGEEARVTLDDTHYTSDWNDRTYDACFDAAEDELWHGKRVVLDGTFRSDRHRRRIAALAERWSVPCCVFVCEADPELVRQRLDSRPPGSSDAGWDVYQALAAKWDVPDDALGLPVHRLSTAGDPEATLQGATTVLRGLGLM
jgi:predicted kinase